MDSDKTNYEFNLAGLPAFSQLNHYFGQWAMEEAAFRGTVDYLTSQSIVAHVQAFQSSPEAKAAASSRARAEYDIVDGIAVIDLTGTLMKTVSSLSNGTSTVNVRKQIREAAADDKVRGILLRVDSPGGTVAGTADLASEITAAIEAGTPCWAYVEDLCASAAYWIASQCNQVVANNTGLVGSIGTYMQVADYSMAAAQKGIKVHVIKAGQFKGTGTTGTEITAEQLADMQRIVSELNAEFTSAVARGRKLSADQIAELADGRVHVSRNALSLGLIDSIGNYESALAGLRASLDTADQRNPKKGPKSMSTDTPAAPKAATMAELKQAFPKADAQFYVNQLEAGATLNQGHSAWSEYLQAKLEAQQAELEKAKAGKPGVPPLGEGRGKVPTKPAGTQTQSHDGDYENPRAEFSAAVAEYMKQFGTDRNTAIKAVAKAQPGLHRAYIKATNPERVHNLIDELADPATFRGN